MWIYKKKNTSSSNGRIPIEGVKLGVIKFEVGVESQNASSSIGRIPESGDWGSNPHLCKIEIYSCLLDFNQILFSSKISMDKNACIYFLQL